MAKQHFYSRVPAKMSMYNRSDGYDTFAHSQGLERDFVEKELAAVYENKLNKNDMEAVRKGLLPRVYSQCRLRSGDTVQTCVTYLPQDYTGERSAYLCHSLILNEEELLSLSRGNAAILNPAMFPVQTIDVSSGAFLANDSYPEADYILLPAEDPRALTEKYGSELLSKFVYALLAVFFGKGKTIYFKLPCADAQVSEEALRFLSAMLAIIPRRVRENLSFVTYVTDAGQYPLTKIRCVAAQCPEISAAKGTFFDFATGQVIGLPTADIMQKAPVDFFCSLLSDAPLREEFLRFIDGAVDAVPKLDKMNMKVLSELVFLFGGASSQRSGESLLPDDIKVYELMCVYEKYRDALSEESRRNIYKCLERYPQRHTAIPKNIFAKLSKLYPAEPDAVKRMAMQVVLDLIHTDIMREKLFSFIKNNYNGEDADIRQRITLDLCRVFYGGFLQIPILTFFCEHFAHEPEETQDAVFEKLMLTIRTESVQQQILQFLRENYNVFSPRQKALFYSTFFEMLPEADALALELVRLVNGTILQESAEEQEQVRSGIAGLLDKPGRCQTDALVAVLCKEEGFCFDTVTELVFGQWSKRKIFEQYLQLLSQRSVVSRTAAVFRIHEIVASLEEAAQGRLIMALDQLFAREDLSATLYHWLEADRIAEQKLAQGKNAFAYLFRSKVVRPAVENSLMDVFNVALGRDGLEIIRRYAEKNTDMWETKGYKVIQLFQFWMESVEKKDAKTLFRCMKQFPQDEQLRMSMANYIRSCLANKAQGDPYRTVLYEISISYLTKGVLLTETIYPRCRELASQPLLEQMKAPKAVREGACLAVKTILGCLVTACCTGDVFLNAVCTDEVGLRTLLQDFAGDYGSGADKLVLSCVSDAPAQLITQIQKMQNLIKPSANSLWSKLFGRK